jgi:hypothetical protein
MVVASPTVAALLSPVVLIGLILSAGLFPGEELIERTRRGVFSRPVSSRLPTVPVPVRSSWVKPVGLALAFALANRPPPALRPTS